MRQYPLYVKYHGLIVSDNKLLLLFTEIFYVCSSVYKRYIIFSAGFWFEIFSICIPGNSVSGVFRTRVFCAAVVRRL